MSIDPATELLDEGSVDSETLVIAWLRPLLPLGQVANGRLPKDDLPFIGVSLLNGEESVEESWTDDLIAVDCLHRRGLGRENMVAAKDFADAVHRRMLLWSRTLEPVTVKGQLVAPEFVRVAMRPRWVEYTDDQVLRKLSRYSIGQGYTQFAGIE